MKLPEGSDKRNAVTILNPISEELSIMRTFLAPSMLANAVRNIRRGNDVGKEFEVANIYAPKELPLVQQPEERRHLVMSVWGGDYDFFDLKGGVESVLDLLHIKAKYVRASEPYLHPGVSADIVVGEKTVGHLGELDPAIAASLGLDKKVFLAEVDLDALAKKADVSVHFTNLPKFPAVLRDLALIVDEQYTNEDVEEVLLHSCKWVTAVKLFDVYRGGQVPEGKKSMAYTLTFTPDATAEKGFTPENLDGFVKKILGNLKFKLGAELR
jgi:phenylalanyl-tRNA synthetase beta chain